MDSKPTPVLMLSAHTKVGAELTIKSLQLGAVDFFTKPSGPISIDLLNYRDELIRKLKIVGSANLRAVVKEKIHPESSLPGDLYMGIGSSTGGVRALNYLVPSLPVRSGLHILIVQHMPPYFTASLSAHLNEQSSLVVKEAQDADLVMKNEVLIAPGGHHIKVNGSGKKVILSDEPPRHGVRPSIDVLFETMSKVYTKKAIGIILTGMGHDGSQGIRSIKERGGITIAQSPQEAVISRMPQSAIDTGSVDYILPLCKIPDKINDIIKNG
jgi:two-component system chemotaxis response regulator CheB